MTIQQILEKTTAQFRSANLPTPRLDAEILISKALRWERIDLLVHSDQLVPQDALEKIISWTQRRSQGEPVAYLIQEKEFFGRMYFIKPGVLVPRPETECLVEQILSYQQKLKTTFQVGLDLGTGSGCLAVTLLLEIPKLKMLAIDVDPVAEEVTLKNAALHLVMDRLRFLSADVLAERDPYLGFPTTVDLIVANPPYIAQGDPEVEDGVRKFEPAKALFSGPTGLESIRSWSEATAPALRRPGLLIFEIGANQGARAKEIVESLNVFDTVEVGLDYSGRERWVAGVKLAHSESQGVDHG